MICGYRSVYMIMIRVETSKNDSIKTTLRVFEEDPMVWINATKILSFTTVVDAVMTQKYTLEVRSLLSHHTPY